MTAERMAPCPPPHEPGRCPWRPSEPCPPGTWPGERERAVLRLLADGLRDAEIAERLGFSVHTVSRWVVQLYDRTGLPRPVNRTRLAVWAERNGHTQE